MVKKGIAMLNALFIIFLINLFFIGKVMAKDLGVQGSVYEITEPNALEWIKNRLLQMNANGGIEKQQQILKEQALRSIERPKAVQGLTKTKIARTFEKDLTVSVSNDIRGPNGEILQKAGTKLNPLSKVFTKKSLIFFDAEDKQQLSWALKEYKERKEQAKLVLINGPVLELMQEYLIPFYFDQAGRLIRYFKIEQVPAIVFQKQDKLIISEVKI